MSATLRPRTLVHRGVVDAVGFVFPDDRARVLAQWTPGAVVFPIEGGWWLRFAATRTLRAERCAGLPATLAASSASAPWTTAPLDARELATLGAGAGDLVRVRGGEAVVEHPLPGDAVDVAAWVTPGDVTVLAVESLGDAPVLAVAAESTHDARAVLADAAPGSASAIAAAFRASLDALLGEGTPGGVLSRMVAAFASVTAWFARRFGDDEPAATDTPTRALATTTSSPGALSRVMEALQRRLSDALRATRLAELLGARYARYLDELIGLFERGELLEALRRAVPLNERGGSGNGCLPLRLPAPRADLSLRPGASGGAASVGVGPGLFERLRALYREAAERLERAGRIEEAAFVLAQLLDDVGAAVALLERHGRLTRAAELAESVPLAPEIIVRQWIVADDTARAVAWARRTHTFEVAVTRLESSHPPLGALLRREWALHLAASGDLTRAVEVAWASPELRLLADPWIARCIALGGVVGARMLARALSLRPERLESTLRATEAMLDNRSPDGLRATQSLMSTLLTHTPDEATRVLARRLARGAVTLGALGHLRGGPEFAARLAQHANDGPLRVDLPAWVEPVRPMLSELTTPRTFALSGVDRGTRAVRDVAVLPDGRLCLAMGESGVWIVARDGHVVSRIDAPATALVMSDHGDRCIATAPRGSALLLTRVDLVACRSVLWATLRLDAFAPTYDGDTWLVAVGREVSRIDALAALPTRLARVVALDDGATVLSIARTPSSVAFCTNDLPGEAWVYDVPQWTLRARRSTQLPDATLLAVDAAGARVARATDGDALRFYDPVMRTCELDAGAPSPARAVTRVTLGTRWSVAFRAAGDATRVTLFDRVGLRARWHGDFGWSRAIAVRVSDDHLALGDEHGRVLVLDLAHGEVLCDLRV